MQVGEALGGFVPMEGDMVTSKYSVSTYVNGRWRGGVTHFMPGWGYKYYSKRTEDVEFVFARPASSSVSTATPTDITAVSAVVGGMVVLPGGSHVFLRGVCWGMEPNPDIDGSHTTEGTGIGSFSGTLEGLNPSTTYYVCAYAVSDYGLAYGNVTSFTTLNGMPNPEVSTAEVTDITATSATCGGTVVADEGLAIIARGVCWSTSSNPTISDSYTIDGTGTGSFVSTLTGLTSNTTYYVRAYATTAQATTYGEEMSFTTCGGVIVTTSEPMLITAISAMSGGEVTVSDGTYILVKGLCWATHENPSTNDDFYQEAESGVGSFSLSMTGLNISTTYYVRAYAVTPNGTVYGDQKTFTTRDGIPTLTTAEVTNITGITASSGGNITDNGGLNVTARGVCWSTSPNPTVADSNTTNGSGDGSFGSSITGLSLSTTYYVRAYATTTAGTGYGEEKTFTTRDGIPLVTTTEVTIIETTWAYSGGNITDDGGLSITDRGVCWSVSPNPTLADSHTSNGGGTGNFTSYITGLNWNTTYYVRAYATNSHVTVYGNQRSFTTEAGGGGGGDHAYVDLGLPSGLLWATCNVGADTPEDYGDYFAWGETQPKDTYNWSTYQYCNGSYNTLTKYCNNSSYGYNGFTDNLTTLLPEDDAATANWGSDWRMPTREEWQELYQNTTHTWTTQNGVNGRLFTASNGNSLFLPAAGYRDGSSLYDAGSLGYYWSSSLYTDGPRNAWDFRFGSGSCNMGGSGRYYGQSVRPVRSFGQN